MDQRGKRTKEIEINLVPLLKELLRNVWLMVLVGVMLGGFAYSGTKLLMKPEYRCSFTAYVNNQQQQNTKDILTNSDINASKELVRTYSQIIRSNSILSAAADSIGLELPYGTLKGMVTTEIKNDTEIITVYVVSQDPELSFNFANAIAETAPTYMAEIIEGSSMRIIDHPIYNDSPFGPNYFKYALVAFALGVLIVIVTVVIRYFKDDTVKSESEIEAQFSLPVLGVIPDINTSKNPPGKHSIGRYGYGYEYGYSTANRTERSDTDEKESE